MIGHTHMVMSTHFASLYAGTHLRYTASQTVAFCRALPHLMARYVVDAEEPAWKSMLAHVHYFELKMARQFTDESILELEAATVAHQVRAACP